VVQATCSLETCNGTRRPVGSSPLSDPDEYSVGTAERIHTLDIGADSLVDISGGRGRPYFRTLQAYDHTGTALHRDEPTLLLQGEQDHRITVKEDLRRWCDAFDGTPHVTVRVYSKLNHRPRQSKGAMTVQGYFEPERPIDERVIRDVAAS
jgi:alpha-beta hydrolase superfamily lysophospholipase